MAYDRYFGFDTTQRQTLIKLLAEVVGADLAALQQQIDDLEGRVEVLEAGP